MTSDLDDSAMKGPLTLKRVLVFILVSSGTPMGVHQTLWTSCRLLPGDGPVVEHEGISGRRRTREERALAWLPAPKKGAKAGATATGLRAAGARSVGRAS